MDRVKKCVSDTHGIGAKKFKVVFDANSKKVAQPSAEERQIAEIERTFTNRWKW